MLHLRIINCAVLLVSIAGFASAANVMYDVNCTAAQTAFLQQTLANAMDLSDNAYVMLDNPTPEFTDVLNFLFNPATANNNGGRILDLPSRTYPIFGVGGASRFNNQVFSNDDLSPDDLKIYCDTSRFVYRPSKLAWVDNDLLNELGAGVSRPCTLNPTEGIPTLMQTLTLDSGVYQLQVCPYFLDWALPAQYKWTTALISKQFWNKVGSALAITLAQFFKFAPIDGFQLFDKVFLHELTHTNPGYVIDDPLGDNSYGWKNCMAMSSTLTTLDGTTQGPERNADTWALIGSIAWAMQNDLITSMNADGSWNT